MSEARTTIDAPFGRLHVTARDGAIRGIHFEHDGHAALAMRVPTDDREPVLVRARAQLLEYLVGERREFDLPLAPEGTPLQLEVWRALARIPFGARSSYAALAATVGRPRAARAIGSANARNPISIVVPCHRVIGADGALTGYAGGLASKEWLLAHEARVAIRHAWGTSAADMSRPST